MSHQIHYQVDQLLLEQGEYLPLEFLLREGRLFYADYELWRNGELDTLDQTLFGDSEQIRQQLLLAEEYLQRRGWQAEAIRYSVWNDRDTTSQPLCFSASHEFDRCFHRRYYKPQDQPQLDLFTDAPATSLANGITQALIDRNGAEARRLLERLYDTAPDHVRLGELEYLVGAAENLDTPVADISAELQNLQEKIVPMAETLLGNNGRNLLIPLWRRLSNALQNRPYQANEPELHRSYTAGQAMDREAVRQAVEGEPGWQNNPVLLLRHARACDSLHEESAALPSWFALCWQFPEQADALESCSNHELRQQWFAFLELDPELPVQSFPAWLLLGKPGLTRWLPEPGLSAGAGETSCPASYVSLYWLQHGRVQDSQAHSRAGREPEQQHGDAAIDVMALRARLRQQDPALFDCFLESMESVS